MLNRVKVCLVVLIGVLCRPAHGRPLPDVNTQDVYQAEEHSNISLMMLSPVNTTSDSLYIDLMRLNPQRSIYLYDSRFQPEPDTDELFRDRLQCDLQLVGNGRIECRLSDLRLSDSGTYEWIVKADLRSNLKTLKLVVKVVGQQTQEETPQSRQRGRLGVYVPFGLCAVVIVFLALRYRTNTFSKFYPDHPPFQK